MTADSSQLREFLAKHPPFNGLPADTLQLVAQQASLRHFSMDNQILTFGEPIHQLYMVYRGVVELYRRNGELYNRLEAGRLFGQLSLLMNNSVRFPAKAIENCDIICLPEPLFKDLCEQHADFADFMEVDNTTRLHQAVESVQDRNDLTTVKVKTLLQRKPATLPPSATVQQAAKLLADENISSVLISNADCNLISNTNSNQPTASSQVYRGNQPFTGIVTEKDLCTRVLAAGLPPDTPVASVMGNEVITLDHNAYLFEALLTMLRSNVHHLPVVRNNEPIGIIEATDLVRYESQNSLLLVSSIIQQTTLKGLQGLSLHVKDCFQRMVNEDANSHMIGTAMAVIGRSFIQRLMELAEESIGPPPIDYCFMTLGSMARDEQLIVTDQDNALILAANYQPQIHQPYFERLANFVSDGLATCGYSYCSGGIMASNPQWRKTLEQWKQCFAHWIDRPQPEALLHSSIFFDLDSAGGKSQWIDELRGFIAERASRSPRFLACLARNALSRTPPLGFFKNFVMEKDGRHNNSINLKRRGTAPLADLIRVHALAAASMATNSFERLDHVIEANLLPMGRGPDLRDAMEFISMVRIRHQALDIAENREPDNNIEPENLSDFERRNLKDAFQIVSNAQNFLKYRYHGNRPG